MCGEGRKLVNAAQSQWCTTVVPDINKYIGNPATSKPDQCVHVSKIN